MLSCGKENRLAEDEVDDSSEAIFEDSLRSSGVPLDPLVP